VLHFEPTAGTTQGPRRSTGQSQKRGIAPGYGKHELSDLSAKGLSRAFELDVVGSNPIARFLKEVPAKLGLTSPGLWL
jgi:hypothetical protein